MSTTWGPYVSVGGGASIRSGVTLSYSPTTVTSGTTSVTVSGTLLVQLSGGTFASGNDSWFTSGSYVGSGTKSWSINSNGGTAVIATFTQVVTLVYGQTQTFNMAFRVEDVGPSGNDALVTGATITIPARPLSVPAAPSAVSVTRVSDSRQDLAWTRNATTAAPYAQLQVQRMTNGVGPPTVIATLAGTATSYADTGTQAGRVYTYSVVATNSAGSATGAASPAQHSTTPLTPAAPSAAKQPSGDIVVTRPALSHGATWSVRHVETGTVLASGLGSNITTWTHTNPSPTQTWTYDVRASSATPVLHSAWSADSATVQLIAPPLAPTPLVPAVADPAEAITLTWQHNPVDGTPQRLYQVETRATSSDPWVALTAQVASTTSQHVVAAGTWAGQTSRQWRVRTWGQHDDPSPYSQTAVLVLSARPVVAITSPAGASHDSPSLTVQWSYYDAEGSGQTQYRLTLFAGASTNVVLEQRSAVTSLKGRTLTTELADGATYTVQVEARDGAGLWSAPATRTFTVTYAPPPTPALAATFRKDDGYVLLTPTVGAPGSGQVAVSHLRVERATPDGWLLVQDNLASGQTVTDMIPPLGTAVIYRAVAVATIGSVAYSTTSVQTDTKWVFINHGPGFARVVRVYGNLEAGRSFSRDKQLKRYDGRVFPVEMAGITRDRTYTLSGTLFAPWAPADLTSSYADFEAAADAGAPVCVRDPEGVKMFVSTSGADLSAHLKVHRRVSMSFTQVDHAETATAGGVVPESFPGLEGNR